jgi:hypothetical protein
MSKKKVKVRMHKAFFLGVPENKEPYLFLNITNLHKQKSITITHTELKFLDPDKEGITIAIINDQRPLPITLKPSEVWETWYKISDIARKLREEYHLLSCGHVRLSTGKYYWSKKNKKVPQAGEVPGKDKK